MPESVLFLTVLPVDTDIRYGLLPKIKTKKIELRSESELTMRLWQSEEKKIQVTAALCLEHRLWFGGTACRMGAGSSCCLDPLQTAVLWLRASGKQRDSNTNSISAVEWEAREQRDMMQSLRKMMLESRTSAVYVQRQRR